jgi:hypothetical protein
MSEMIRLTLEQFDRLSFTVSDRMRGHTYPYITSLSWAEELSVGNHLGSGLYLGHSGEAYILTNEHVARAIRGTPLAHQLLQGEHATRVMNPFQVAKHPYDMALTRIEREVWLDAKNSRVALDISRIASKHDPAESDFLFMLGYSGQRSYFSASFETLFTNATPYLTQESKTVPDGLSDMFFAIPYLPDLAKSLSPNAAGLPDPHGFSGTPVWDTNFRRCMLSGQQWTPEESRITGLVVRWLESTGHIVAVRVEFIREFLLYALRCEAAYFNWIRRGRPSNDGFADWVWAEKALPNLETAES